MMIGCISIFPNDYSKNAVCFVTSYCGKFYIACRNGICVWDNGKLDWSLNDHIRRNNPQILAAAFEETGSFNEKLWLLGEAWLGYIQNNNFTVIADNFKLPVIQNNYNACLSIDKNGNVFFGNSWAKYCLNKSSRQLIPMLVKNGFTSNGCASIFIDYENNIWLSDYRGIDKISNTFLVNYYSENGMLEDEVAAIGEMSDGGILLGHNNGLTIFKDNKYKLIDFSGMKNNPSKVLDIMRDSKGNIWFTAKRAWCWQIPGRWID